MGSDGKGACQISLETVELHVPGHGTARAHTGALAVLASSPDVIVVLMHAGVNAVLVWWAGRLSRQGCLGGWQVIAYGRGGARHQVDHAAVGGTWLGRRPGTVAPSEAGSLLCLTRCWRWPCCWGDGLPLRALPVQNCQGEDGWPQGQGLLSLADLLMPSCVLLALTASEATAT